MRSPMTTVLVCLLVVPSIPGVVRAGDVLEKIQPLVGADEADAWTATVSLPIPRRQAENLYADGKRPVFALGGAEMTARPVGWWQRPDPARHRGGIPRRVLLYAASKGALGEKPLLSVASRKGPARPAAPSPWTVSVRAFKTTDYRGYEVMLRGGSYAESTCEFDDLVLTYKDKQVILRPGTRRDKFHGSQAFEGTHDWWQWGRVEPLLDTAQVKLVRVGGLGYNEDTFMHYDVYLELYGNGVGRAFVHFVNTRFIGDGWAYYGIPVVGIGSTPGARLERTLDGTQTRFDLGGLALDISDSAELAGKKYPGRLYPHDGLTVYQPWKDQRVTDLVRTFGKEFVTDIGEGKMLRGLARTVRFTFSVSDAPPKVARCLAPPWLYAMSEELWHGQELPAQWRLGHATVGIASQIAKPDRRYHGTFEGGYTAAASTGNGGASLIYSAMYAGVPRHLARGLSFTYAWADIMVDHVDWSIRQPYTGYYWKTPPYTKFNDLVWGYLQTGDPYLLETAEHCANAYTALMRSTWPARSMGRGAMPAVAQVRLYQYLREPYYLRCAADIVKKGLFTFSDPNCMPGGQIGVGPHASGNWSEVRGFHDFVLCESALEVALSSEGVLSNQERARIIQDATRVVRMALDAVARKKDNDWLNYETDMIIVVLLRLARARNRPDLIGELEPWIAQMEDYLKGPHCGRPHHAVTGRACYDSVTLGARWEDGTLVIRPKRLPAAAAKGRTATVWTPAGKVMLDITTDEEGEPKITPKRAAPCKVDVERGEQARVDLSPYIARGFPGNFDALIAKVPVAGIDREQAQSMVRVCEATEQHLYEGGYSPTSIRYRTGARPQLERIAAGFPVGSPRERALAAMAWVNRHVAHPHIVGPVPPDRAMTEEQIVASGVGWCNEQTRVFVALCEVMGIPARLCFLFHKNGKAGHTAAEAYVDGRWAFFDVTFNLAVTLPSGMLAEARELSGRYRELAHQAYAPVLRDYYARMHPSTEDAPGWNKADRPDPDRGGDLLHTLGVANYLIDGIIE